MNPSRQPVSFALAGLCFLASFLVSAQVSAQGSFVTYGSGCPGSVSAICASANSNTTQSPKYAQNSLTFALQVPATSKVTLVDGFALYTRATSSSFQLTTRLYAASGGKPSTLLATGSMTVGTTLGWHRTTFPKPVTIPANVSYFLYYAGGTSRMLFPFVPSGALSTHVYAWQGGWAGPFTTNAWAWRVICRQVPQISCNGVPTIGQKHVIQLTKAKANAPAFLAIGTGRLSPGLPWAGAPGCFLLNNAKWVFPLSTDSTGSINLTERVPNNQKLKGTKWPHQFAVVDPTNAAGLVFSAGGEVRL